MAGVGSEMYVRYARLLRVDERSEVVEGNGAQHSAPGWDWMSSKDVCRAEVSCQSSQRTVLAGCCGVPEYNIAAGRCPLRLSGGSRGITQFVGAWRCKGGQYRMAWSKRPISGSSCVARQKSSWATWAAAANDMGKQQGIWEQGAAHARPRLPSPSMSPPALTLPPSMATDACPLLTLPR
ncbi:hypothetical protein K469DRAFT_92749 [Zopfia rhizophila CBS 207.26]|uniref:Uncharacterized protein n=1 Tax=Zopfia rhizophila CBS 207.26 TaxID=1314779 RepID=A0A6A6E8Q3_9PEZI|nr:hypothetical protein K469DRAFT_92749 [Zopfia rhizophila CBS 207.26]